MSAKEKIAHLQALLARVQRRAGEARLAVPAVVAVTPPVVTDDEGVPSMDATAELPALAHPATLVVNEPPAMVESVPPEVPEALATAPEDAFPTIPPEPTHPSSVPPVTTAEPDMEMDVDVEVSTETVDIDVDVDVDMNLDESGMPLESGAQPVAGHVPFGDDTDDTVSSEVAVPADLPLLEPIPAEPTVQALANELEEPAPSSSPRPITSDKPEAFEEESAPRHTPPPESGKQVALSPSSPPKTKSSIPPALLEGHTLMGGWREPGLGGPVIGAPPGAEAPAQAMGPEPVTGLRATPPERPLTPEITRAELPGGAAHVASFEGAPPAFAPSTFGELLDASLSL